MSWKASAWAKEQRLGSPAAKSILLCLADYADAEKAECWPSQAQLAEDAEVSERTAREWLQRLAEWGLIARSRRQRASGARAADRIVLHLDVKIADGADRCREGKACAAEADENLPANSAGRTNRRSYAGQPASDDEPTGNQFRAYKEEPPKEPPNRTSQGARQGARERGEDGTLENSQPEPMDRRAREALERRFWKMARNHPQSAGMPKQAWLKGWLKLSPEKQDLAEARYPAWLELLKRQGKSHVPALSTYFEQELFEEVPEPEVEKPAALEAKPFGKLWQAARMKRLIAGPTQAAGSLTAFQRKLVEHGEADESTLMREKLAASGWPAVNHLHREASFGRGVMVAPELERLAALMEQVRVGSECWEEWRREHEARGWPWLPDPGRQEWVYFPRGGPAGLREFEAALWGEGGTQEQVSEAAE